MRVTHNTLYKYHQLNLNRLGWEMNQANQKITTGKKINTLSDDPVGLGHLLDLKSSLSTFVQYQRNITTGQRWLDFGSQSLDRVLEMAATTRSLDTLNEGTINQQEADLAAEQVRQMLIEMKDLANMKVDGNYIFAGTRTDTKPFTLDSETNPTYMTYSGNADTFSVKTGDDTTIKVGHDGDSVFGSTTVTIDTSNNMIDFTENGGAEINVTIPSGTYTTATLATAVGTAMTAATGVGATYTVTYDSGTRAFTIAGSGGTLTDVDFLWDSGTNGASGNDNSIASVMGYGPADETDAATSYTGAGGVQWGVFRTMIELIDQFENNDVSGKARSLTELTTFIDNLKDTIAQDIVAKQVRLDARATVVQELEISYTSQIETLENMDVAEAILDLQSKELAYQVALESTSRVVQLSLANYL
jgi:flagellar hook-associated protein 3